MVHLGHAVSFAAALSLGFMIIALGGNAARAQAVTQDIAQVPAGKYKLDGSHANVIFLVSHGGYASYVGRFNTLEGDLKLNVKDPTKSTVSVTIDAKSVDTPVEALDEHLRKADFFDVEKYPEIKFKSTKIERIDDKTGKVTGNLTLLGVTKPVTLDVTFNGGGLFAPMNAYKTGFSARASIKRSEFGMNKFLGFLGDEVSLIIEAEFMQAK
jgi:polyisoprenoid-binding protein YceI